MARRARPKRGAAQLGGLLLASPPLLLVGVFIGLPVLTAIGFSLGYTGGINSTIATVGRTTYETESLAPTFAAYQAVLGNERFRSDLGVTLMVTAVVTVVVLVAAWVLALNMRLNPGRISNALPTLAVIPMFIPVVIGAWAMLKFWAADGFVGSVVANLGGRPPQLGFSTPLVVIAQIWSHLPFAVLMITSGVAAIPDSLLDAARDAGASTWRVIWSVILPMCLMPTIIAGTFTAIGLLGSFTVPYFTGPNSPSMLGVSMARYFQAYGMPQQSVVMAVIVFALASVFGSVYVWANHRSARELP